MRTIITRQQLILPIATRNSPSRVRANGCSSNGREWPKGEAEPTKYWLSTLPGTTKLADLVTTAKLRWRIERDYQNLKQEIGLGHYEGRGWQASIIMPRSASRPTDS